MVPPQEFTPTLRLPWSRLFLPIVVETRRLHFFFAFFGVNECNRDFSSIDSRWLKCIPVDRTGLASKVLLGLAVTAAVLPIFWFAGGIRWLDTKVFPPRRPKDMPQNAVWIDAPALTISWHHGWWFGCDVAHSGDANRCRLVMAKRSGGLCGGISAMSDQDSTASLHD